MVRDRRGGEARGWAGRSQSPFEGEILTGVATVETEWQHGLGEGKADTGHFFADDLEGVQSLLIIGCWLLSVCGENGRVQRTGKIALWEDSRARWEVPKARWEDSMAPGDAPNAILGGFSGTLGRFLGT